MPSTLSLLGVNVPSGLLLENDTYAPCSFPLKVHAPSLPGWRAEGGGDRELGTIPKAPGRTSPLAPTTKALCVRLASALGDQHRGFFWFQSNAISLTLAFLFSFTE